MSERFYIVWSPDGRSNPKFIHNLDFSAENEAERLAQCNPGKEFFVMGAFSSAKTKPLDIETKKFEEDPLPF